MYDRETNKQILDYMQALKGFSDSSYAKYENDLRLYSKWSGMNLEELLEEAEEDEDNGLRMRKRRINKRMTDFQKHLETAVYENPKTKKKSRYSPSSINGVMRSLKAFYHCYDIQTPMIRNKRQKIENKDDLITRKEIREALSSLSNEQHKAIILILASSGLDVESLLTMTVGDYCKATRNFSGFTPSLGIRKFLEDLDHRDDVVPTFTMERKKTHYEHIFFFSPEACNMLNKALLVRIQKGEDLTYDSPLISIGKPSIHQYFNKLNDKLGYGWTSNGTRRRFRPHGLRAFFASTLLGATINNMMIDTMVIEFMLGHTIPATTAAYYKKKPELLKKIYVAVMNNLTFTEYLKVKTIKSDEYKEMEKQLEKYKELEEKIAKLEKLQGLYSKLD